MRKTRYPLFLSIVALFAVLTGCGGNKVAPVRERIAKVWTANIVTENSQTVYTRGQATNVRNYTTFRLDLSSPPNVTYVDYDNTTFTGQYSVPSDTRLVLTDLTPQPTGTNGTIEFTISNLTDNSVTLTRTTASQKTGGTTNAYQLTNP